MPALISVWRAMFGPPPAWRAQPKISSSTSAGATPARSRRPRTAAAPRSAGVRSANEPRNLAIGVRTEARTAARSMTSCLPRPASDAGEGGLPLLEERAEPFLHVRRGGEEPEVGRLGLEAVREVGLEPADGRVHRAAHRD